MFDYTHLIEKELTVLRKECHKTQRQIDYLRKNAKIHIFIDNYKLLRKGQQFSQPGSVEKCVRFVIDEWMERPKL